MMHIVNNPGIFKFQDFDGDEYKLYNTPPPSVSAWIRIWSELETSLEFC